MVTIDYKKRNRISRGRGYNHEHAMILNINALPDWYARRLGGSSTGLPDIVAVNNKRSRLFAIECKSITDGTKLHVPKDQVQRCIDIVTMFSIYRDRNVMFSFKFSNSATKRAVLWHFLLANECYNLMDSFEDLVCDIGGKCAFYSGTDVAIPLMRFIWDYELKQITA